MKTDSSIQLVLCFDDNFAIPAGVTIKSACANLPSHQTVDLHLIIDGLSADNRAKLEAMFPNNIKSFTWITAPITKLRAFPSAPPSAPIAYARCLFDELLDQNVSRFIYLDTDTLVFANLAKLWNLDWGDYVILAARDQAWPTFASAPGIDHASIAIPADTPYFCSGVLCVNMIEWRLLGIAEKSRAYARAHWHTIQAEDQDILNSLLIGRWGELDPRWDCIDVQYMPDPSDAGERERQLMPFIWHFAGTIKPWQSTYVGAGRKLFFKQLENTPWEGWRPAPIPIWRQITPTLKWALGATKRRLFPIQSNYIKNMIEFNARGTAEPRNP